MFFHPFLLITLLIVEEWTLYFSISFATRPYFLFADKPFVCFRMVFTSSEDLEKLVEPLRVLAFAVALELLPGQVWAAEGLGR